MRCETTRPINDNGLKSQTLAGKTCAGAFMSPSPCEVAWSGAGEQEYRTLGRSIFTVFTVAAAGDYEADTYLNTHFPVATATLLCLFLFVVTVMLFNVLIALLTNASQKAQPGFRAIDIQFITLALAQRHGHVS